MENYGKYDKNNAERWSFAFTIWISWRRNILVKKIKVRLYLEYFLLKNLKLKEKWRHRRFKTEINEQRTFGLH